MKLESTTMLEPVPKWGVRTRVRELFNKNVHYTVEELAVLTRSSEKKIREIISCLKNPDYVSEPLDLVQTIEKDTRIKRWGLRDATECYRGS